MNVVYTQIYVNNDDSLYASQKYIIAKNRLITNERVLSWEGSKKKLDQRMQPVRQVSMTQVTQSNARIDRNGVL